MDDLLAQCYGANLGACASHQAYGSPPGLSIDPASGLWPRAGEWPVPGAIPTTATGAEQPWWKVTSIVR
jgi:hypothetical protein